MAKRKPKPFVKPDIVQTDEPIADESIVDKPMADADGQTVPELSLPSRVRFLVKHETNTHNFAAGLVFVCDSDEQAKQFINDGVAEAY